MLSFVKDKVMLLGIVVLTLTLTGCFSSAPKPRKAQSQLDTPQHHVLRGNDLIEAQQWTRARREYQLALEMNPNYSPALAGQALILAHDTTLPGKSDEEKATIIEKAEDSLDKALSNANGDRETAQAHVMAIRVLSMLKTDDWLDEAESHFDDAKELYNEEPELQNFRAEPHFYMARAYQQASLPRKANTQYSIVLELNQSFTREADLELERLQKSVRANLGTRHGELIANQPFITRGDMAALLIEELRLAQLYQRDSNQQQYDTSYKAPNQTTFVSPAQRKEIPEATDIDQHPLRSDIEEILRIGVRGLEASPQHLFNPDKKVSRAEYALMLEDILIQVTKDATLSTRFIGESSPWPDVRESAYYYNAARTLVSRNIMTVVNKTRGEFGPELPVNGTDALLGIRTLKDELQNYIRNPQS